MASTTRPEQLHRRRARGVGGRERSGAQPGDRRGAGAGADLERRGRRSRGGGRARRRSTAGRGRRPPQRAQALLALADVIEEHGEEIARLEALNAGKPIEAVTSDEIPVMADNLRFFAGAARCLEGRAAGEYMEGYTSFTRREAVGVIGQVTPWNYPLMMAIWKIAPGARGGQHGRAEARGDDADDDRAPRRAGGGDPAQGRAERRHRPRRADGRGADHPPRRGHGRADRLGGHRQALRAHRRGHAQARAPRARRQGAGGRLRRRRACESALETIAGTGYYNAGQDCTAATRVLAGGRSTTTSSPASPSRRRGW